MSELARRVREFAERQGVDWVQLGVCEVCDEDAFWDGYDRCVHPNCEPEEEF